jgi:hypothetical protein
MSVWIEFALYDATYFASPRAALADAFLARASSSFWRSTFGSVPDGAATEGLAVPFAFASPLAAGPGVAGFRGAVGTALPGPAGAPAGFADGI